MNILLTNDDGYTSNGLQALRKILQKFGTVYMVAPQTPQSGKGCGLTTFLGLKAHKIDEYNYVVEGTPVDCVMFAEILLKGNIDLVVSGCNNGYNLSLDSMYSGTCGACFQALISKKKAIAFSCEKYEEPTQINQEVEKVLNYIFDNNLLSNEYFLSVNLQNPIYKHAKGIKITKLFIRHTKYQISSFDSKTDFYRIEHDHDDITNCDDFDVSAVYNGYISITPLGITTYHEAHYEDLIKKIK